MQKIIIKYDNRKLYDKEIKSYISLQELEKYAINNITFCVIEHKSQNDITNKTLVKVLANKLDKSVNNSTDSLINLIKNA